MPQICPCPPISPVLPTMNLHNRPWLSSAQQSSAHRPICLVARCAGEAAQQVRPKPRLFHIAAILSLYFPLSSHDIAVHTIDSGECKRFFLGVVSSCLAVNFPLRNCSLFGSWVRVFHWQPQPPLPSPSALASGLHRFPFTSHLQNSLFSPSVCPDSLPSNSQCLPSRGFCARPSGVQGVLLRPSVRLAALLLVPLLLLAT